MADLLNSGDTFPSLSLSLSGGGTLTTPDDFDSTFSVVIFYRGHW